MLPFDDRDTAEIRLMRAITELNQRILMTESPEQRTALRSAVSTLRTELLNLIQSMPIYDEEDVSKMTAHRCHGHGPIMVGS